MYNKQYCLLFVLAQVLTHQFLMALSLLQAQLLSAEINKLINNQTTKKTTSITCKIQSGMCCNIGIYTEIKTDIEMYLSIDGCF